VSLMNQSPTWSDVKAIPSEEKKHKYHTAVSTKYILVVGAISVGIKVDRHGLGQTLPQPVVFSQKFFPKNPILRQRRHSGSSYTSSTRLGL
jgi:hypothetical protein